ncbi:uncharacterized protein LOC116404743 isoform X2 [Cucumis sativus]|uniref:uncharacterized protein LOC116404743 isoform X2 n=1 Tax=Cucumis sativus TaxID=3659 RepID=UPI0012F4B97C|nr:uncharacterized protein LOC116404743 isoform X2 [Cucumis sativus]
MVFSVLQSPPFLFSPIRYISSPRLFLPLLLRLFLFSYYKVCRAKESVTKLLKGDVDNSYALIPKFFSKLKEINPGSFTAYEIDANGHFKYCFMAIASSIEGWTYCRPNIAVDGTFLKLDDFELYMRWMESIYPSFKGYLMKVGFKRWSRTYSRKRRYQIMTTNICESLNSKLKIGRDLPVASLFEVIREFLQQWFYEKKSSIMFKECFEFLG